ncbi:unnamed protein product, partial [Iphiclides podalirius]
MAYLLRATQNIIVDEQRYHLSQSAARDLRLTLGSSSGQYTSAMLFTILIYLVYYMVYTVLLAIAGLWCFEECVLTEEEEHEFATHHRAMPY